MTLIYIVSLHETRMAEHEQRDTKEYRFHQELYTA
jgi:hypothetical protein